MYMKKSFFLDWLSLIIAWVGISYLMSALMISNAWVFIETLGVEVAARKNPMTSYWTSYKQFVEASIFGSGFGTLFLCVEYLSHHWNIGQYALGRIIFIKTILYVLSFCLVGATMMFVLSALDFFPTGIYEAMWEVKSLPAMLLFACIYMVLMVIFTNFVMQINRKIGPGNLVPLLLGKYRRPQIENRAFLFIDLKSSTTYAEKLGHIQYSKLIRDCFQDLNKVLKKHQAEIYQYVGDEAVLTWRSKAALKNLNIIGVFYAFKERLKKREKYYLKNFGLIPEFKAGANFGEVTVTEIGDHKREIAYHGDVLNTAARIQSNCNTYKKSLLISENLHQAIADWRDYQSCFIGELELKGKSKMVKVFCVELPATALVDF